MSKNGTVVLVSLGATALAGQVSSNIDLAIDLIETTVKQSPARSKTYEAGENGLTFSVESQLTNAEGATIAALVTAAKAGTAQAFVYNSAGAIGDLEITGNALISGISFGDPKNDVRTVSFNLTATGEYTAAAITA